MKVAVLAVLVILVAVEVIVPMMMSVIIAVARPVTSILLKVIINIISHILKCLICDDQENFFYIHSYQSKIFRLVSHKAARYRILLTVS